MVHYISYPTYLSPFVVQGLPVRWYSLMYLVAFTITFLLFNRQRKQGLITISLDDTLSLFLYAIGFLILGARLGSALLYEGSLYYVRQPWLIFWPFENGQFVGLPGMSYHGGLIGAVVGCILFAKRYKFRFFHISDVLAAGIPLGYTFGRLGNFINGELWGRVSTHSWAMIFPRAPRFSTNYGWVREVADKIGMEYEVGAFLNLPRHPSQLYEALFEGIILWAFLWFIIKPRKKREGEVVSWYLIGYGVVRFMIEYLREPDSNLGFIIAGGAQTEPTALFLSFLNISMGQLLSFLMILGGVVLLVVLRKYAPPLKKKPIRKHASRR